MEKGKTVNILMIEDEAKLLGVVKAYVEAEGYVFTGASGGVEGMRLFNSRHFDLLLLDLMLPGMSGETVAEEIRKNSSIPIIMLTAKSAVESKIGGFKLGADDYVTKPFNPRELMERMRAVLRRTYPDKSDVKVVLAWAGLEIDENSRSVRIRGSEISLTPKEFDLLYLMTAHPNRIFTREQLLESVFGFDYEGYDRTVDAHIKNLRKKIEKDPSSPRIVKTVFGIGYKVSREAAE
ncbi:MAG: response regulator transcription factor [Peptostreptococcaceae bacterium]|nr:response regulator transcription factor [Peptostreptococcaceae bacterium]